jgi:L-methionine (R)-S-oxide reductase
LFSNYALLAEKAMVRCAASQKNGISLQIKQRTSILNSMKIISQDTLTELPAFCEKHNLVGSLANVSALLMSALENINWLGFYLYDGQKLILGPFQGQPACTEIAIGKGVCGKAAKTRTSIRVDNVNEFPGHIVCDSRSQSELVVPLVQDNQLVGVLDVDSPLQARFTHQDQIFFEKVAQILVTHLIFGEKK